MRKHFLIIIGVFFFFVTPLIAKADFGDLRYEITDVEVNGSNITFKGWAFIHRTNNFVTVKSGSKVVADNGGQMILMQAVDNNGKVIETIAKPGSDEVNYNFYCELFYKGYSGSEYYGCRNPKGKVIGKKYYESNDINTCKIGNNVKTQCYYEDLYFAITFKTGEWNVSDLNNITFKIAASNNFFENKRNSYGNGFYYENNYYTKLDDVSIARASIKNFNNKYIEINKGKIEDKVEFIASKAILLKPNDDSNKFVYKNSANTTYGSWGTECKSNSTYFLVNDSNYPNGRSNKLTNDRCEDFLGYNCKGSYNYLIRISATPEEFSNNRVIACPTTQNSGGTVAVARGSHVKPSGKLQISIKNDKKCSVTNPLPDKLECNNSGTLSSTCEELTIHTDKGSAVVKIVQTGTVSSVLTPGKIYAGGGFNFGIMYYNNIKWSYVGSVPGNELHNAVNNVMNGKLKDYESYIAGINISNLKLDGEYITNGMIKQCFSSSTNKDYYGDNGLSVTCIFTFPSSTVGYDGNITYNSASTIDINNKYYTLMDKYGDLEVTATISGMDRITDSAAKGDSKEQGKAWTGNWSDSIDGCEIKVYPLFYNGDGKYNFIYRPIDINNPFPNRNAGINWYDWYNVSSNKNRLINTYSELDYIAKLDNNTIANIKNYNKNNNYLDWDTINKNTGNSSFVSDYVERVGDS